MSKNSLEFKNEVTIDIETARKEIFNLFNECDIQNAKKDKVYQQKLNDYKKNNFNKRFNYKINDDQLARIINQLSNNKSAGFNMVSNEMVKYGLSQKLLKILQLVYETIINFDLIRKISIFVKLPVKDKNKSSSDMNNLRTLTISDTWAIILEKLILEYVSKTVKINSNHLGFRPKASCGHAIFTLRELAVFHKRRKKQTLICSIDAKAFDKVNRVYLGVKLIELLEVFSMTDRGVKQIGTLSPWFFSIYIDELGSLLNGLNTGVKIGVVRINNILYADDIILLADDAN
ncbi:unnamed protein product [Brachionus calyciflorus]|uniref:Reverse transcriptase domain-containing protein n=1 Tax=Brachionus calyciflorus TaxID=104777 RepID=A0A814GY76_9BILA|nr:unnamed protein product [Brachionus calyciflorus]